MIGGKENSKMGKVLYENRVFWETDSRYVQYRIPGMIVTQKGTLLAYCEARTSPSDWALMDVILCRSEDGGKSFGAQLILAAGNNRHKTVNNPVMVQDRNGRIHFLYCEDYGVNNGRVLRKFSDDDGLTWSEPLDLTSATMPEYRNAFALGPGHGICLTDGTLLIPVWMVPKRYGAKTGAHCPSEVCTLYSVDNGETWKMGEILGNTEEILSPNETEAAETSDGGVYLNLRHLSMQRAVAYSDNGYSAWHDYHADYRLNDPQCFGSVISFCDGIHPRSLLFANCNSKEARKNVTVRISTDDGKNWTGGKVLDAERGGYTEMAADEKNGRVYVLYENSAGYSEHLAIFNYEWLLND